jgi:hypothetical protein
MTPKIEITDFVAYLPQHYYVYLPTREPWPASSVNSQLPDVAVLDADGKPKLNKKGEPITISASEWLDQNRQVHQMTWAPGHEMIIYDKLVAEGGWFEKPDARVLNLYRPPTLALGKGSKMAAMPWLDHIRRIYPDDAAHIVFWLAHRVQHPQDKINHALCLGGAQGIGKDTLLEPIKHAVGSWNFIEVSPSHMSGSFNGFVKSVILRISEARDLGDKNRYQFYDHMKIYTAAPPDVLRCNEKHLREHSVFNCCGAIITSNYKTEGIFLPADDRRHYVAWSECIKDDFTKSYWPKLWRWYANGGIEAVASYLHVLDLSAFDAKAPPTKTDAFWAIVDASRAPEESELADVLDRLGDPPAVTLQQILERTEHPSHLSGQGSFFDWLKDRKNRRIIPHRFEQVGYVPVNNPSREKQRLWVVAGTRQTIYARKDLSLRDQLAAAEKLRREADAAKPGNVVRLKTVTKILKPVVKSTPQRRQ